MNKTVFEMQNKKSFEISSEEEADEILKHEMDYFYIPEELKNVADRAIDAEDYFFEIADYADEPKDPKGLSVKVFRSKQWTSGNPEKDVNFRHKVIYYCGLGDLCREYLPDDLDIYLKNKFEILKKDYPAMSMSDERKRYLEKRIYSEKNATEEEKNEFEEYHKQLDNVVDEYKKIKRASVLKHPLIEKTIITFNNPLIIRGYDFDRATSFVREKIKDIRYITTEEIEKIKKEGHDGIVFEQYGWFIKFK